jgi:hypothetical protein
MVTNDNKALNAADFGMVQVTKTDFFAYVGPRDIVVSAQGSSGTKHGLYCNFETRHRQLVGRVFGAYPTSIFMLKPELANREKQANAHAGA